MGLKPELISFLHARNESVLPEVWQAPVSTIRKNLENRAVQSGEPEKIYEVVHRYIPGPTADLPVRLSLLYPKHNDRDQGCPCLAQFCVSVHV